jgi:hypothetical protein
MSAFGTKLTNFIAAAMSADDPKQTFEGMGGMTSLSVPRDGLNAVLGTALAE